MEECREERMVADHQPMMGLDSGNKIFQGAESKVYEVVFLGKPTIVKHRFSKKYRLPELDERLTVGRMKQEARCMLRARKHGILTPVLYLVDNASSCVYMEKIVGKTVREMLGDNSLSLEEKSKLFQDIGRTIGKLHDADMVHGDLTTSNIMVRDSDKALVLIDFGLSSYSKLAEDKGVDLYVLERAITSAHPGLTEAFGNILQAYEKTTRQWTSINSKYREVRMRGRKRVMVG